MERYLERFNEDEYIIVSDFDGTITLDDSNGLLVRVCGSAENARIEADFISGVTSNRETFRLHFDEMRLSLREYYDFLDACIKIDPGFDAFLEQARKRGISLFIVSTGFRQAIGRVLGEGRLQGVEVYANDLRGAPYITPRYATEQPDCDMPFGPCSHCKRDCLREIRRRSGRKILYIGDGLTDRCAIGEADLLFAKDALTAFCEAQSVPYIPYKDFFDVASRLGWVSGCQQNRSPDA